MEKVNNLKKRNYLSLSNFSGQTFSTHEISLTIDGGDTICDNLQKLGQICLLYVKMDIQKHEKRRKDNCFKYLNEKE